MFRMKSRAAVLSIAAQAIAAICLVALPSPDEAAAHVPLELQILSPSDGANVQSEFDIRIRATRTGPLSASTEFLLEIDGRFLDQSSSLRDTRPLTGFRIAADEIRRVRTPRLPPGPHVLTLTYRPHSDTSEVALRREFVVGRGSPVLYLVAALVTIVILAASIWSRRRAHNKGRWESSNDSASD